MSIGTSEPKQLKSIRVGGAGIGCGATKTDVLCHFPTAVPADQRAAVGTEAQSCRCETREKLKLCRGGKTKGSPVLVETTDRTFAAGEDDNWKLWDYLRSGGSHVLRDPQRSLLLRRWRKTGIGTRFNFA